VAGQGLGVIRHRAVEISKVRAYQPAVLGGLGWGSWLRTLAPDHDFTMAFLISPPIAVFLINHRLIHSQLALVGAFYGFHW